MIDGPELIRCASVYVPHGREVGHWHYDYKLSFLAALRDQVTEWLAAGSLVLGGDVNLAPTDSDIFHPDAFVGLTHVTQPEREALAAVLDLRGPSDLSTSCTFDGRARVAFLAVPEGNHTLQVVAPGPDDRFAQLALPAPARAGATLLEARMANAT